MLISDTIHYRPDGTVSGVTRKTRESYETPSGRGLIEDVDALVTIGDVTAVLGAAYQANEVRHAELEQLIADERIAALASEEAVRIELSDAIVMREETFINDREASIAAVDKILREKDEEIATARAALREKEEEIARVTSERDAAVLEAIEALPKGEG